MDFDVWQCEQCYTDGCNAVYDAAEPINAAVSNTVTEILAMWVVGVCILAMQLASN